LSSAPQQEQEPGVTQRSTDRVHGAKCGIGSAQTVLEDSACHHHAHRHDRQREQEPALYRFPVDEPGQQRHQRDLRVDQNR
jgi:hypothetical protein